MKKTKALIAACLIFFSGVCMAQNNQKEKAENQLTITGITGKSIKGSPDEKTITKLINDISNQIIKEKLTTKNSSDLSYMLNSKEFIINGALQTEEVHLRYKNQYIKNHTDWNICKNYKAK